MSDEPLSPAQQDVLDQLGTPRGERPTFEGDLRDRLWAELEEVAVLVSRRLPDDETLWVSKHALAQVLGCERRYLAEQAEGFEWSTPVARGVISHKAIELSMHWPVQTTPLDLVDETLARLEADTSGLGVWIQGLADAERSELRNEVNTRVAGFLECWPPLKKQWRPVCESSTRAELASGRVVLAGKVDLSLGRAEGNTAGKVLIDLKTGRPSATHRDDLRYYALLDTLRIGTPPRRVATYYLDQGRFSPEDVTVGVLDAAVARATDAMELIVELRTGTRPPETSPGPSCRWCLASADCEPGQLYLNRSDDELDRWPDLDDVLPSTTR